MKNCFARQVRMFELVWRLGRFWELAWAFGAKTVDFQKNFQVLGTKDDML